MLSGAGLRPTPQFVAGGRVYVMAHPRRYLSMSPG
jgi:hypothetical protein